MVLSIYKRSLRKLYIFSKTLMLFADGQMEAGKEGVLEKYLHYIIILSPKVDESFLYIMSVYLDFN